MPTPIAQRPLEYLFSVSSVDAMKIRVQNGHSKQFETETTARTQRNITQNIECPQNKTKWREERKTKYWKRKSAIIWARTWVQNTKEKRATGEWADINGHDMAWSEDWRASKMLSAAVVGDESECDLRDEKIQVTVVLRASQTAAAAAARCSRPQRTYVPGQIEVFDSLRL